MNVKTAPFLDVKLLITGVLLLFLAFIKLQQSKLTSLKFDETNTVISEIVKNGHFSNIYRILVEFIQSVCITLMPLILIDNLPIYISLIKKISLIEGNIDKALYICWIIFITYQFLFYFYYNISCIRSSYLNIKSQSVQMNTTMVLFVNKTVYQIKFVQNVSFLCKAFIIYSFKNFIYIGSASSIIIDCLETTYMWILTKKITRTYPVVKTLVSLSMTVTIVIFMALKESPFSDKLKNVLYISSNVLKIIESTVFVIIVESMRKKINEVKNMYGHKDK